MKAKKFFYLSILYTFIAFGVISIVNVNIDLFGLFSDKPDRTKKVCYDERMGKYLMSLNYIPKNFEALLIGPSLSANINTKEFEGIIMYNLSLMGANVSEEKALIEAILSRPNKIRIVAVCLHPYFTATHGFKAEKMSDKAYYSAFGSYDLIKEYQVLLIRKMNLLPDKYPKNQYNAFGHNNYDKLFAVEDVKAKINNELQAHKDEPLPVDTNALNELSELHTILKSQGISILYYFHPIPRSLYLSREDLFLDYKETIMRKLDVKNHIVDFNDSKFSYITEDYDNFIDHGHLSQKGQRYVISILQSQLDLNKP